VQTAARSEQLLNLVLGTQAGVGQQPLQTSAGKPQPRLHRAERQVEPLGNGAVRETLEKSKLHELKLLTRQSAKRGTHTLLPSPRRDSRRSYRQDLEWRRNLRRGSNIRDFSV